MYTELLQRGAATVSAGAAAEVDVEDVVIAVVVDGAAVVDVEEDSVDETEVELVVDGRAVDDRTWERLGQSIPSRNARVAYSHSGLSLDTRASSLDQMWSQCKKFIQLICRPACCCCRTRLLSCGCS